MVLDCVEATKELVRPLWEKVKRLAEERGLRAEFEVYRTPARYIVRYKLSPLTDEVKITYNLSDLLWGAISSLIYMLSKILDYPKSTTSWNMSWLAEFSLTLPNFHAKFRADVSAGKLYVIVCKDDLQNGETYTPEDFAEFLVNTFLLLKQAHKEGDGDV